jgi:hypothetical protein
MNTTTTTGSPDTISELFARAVRRRHRRARLATLAMSAVMLAAGLFATIASAASPCDTATNPGQCAWLDATGLPPYVQDAIAAKNGVIGAGNVLVLTSGDPMDPDNEISTDRSLAGCGTNPDGWQTWDCTLMTSFVPPEDSVVLALSSEWFEWYGSIFTDWMTISGAGVATVDVSINSWIDSKVDIIPYGPWETGVVLLTSLSAEKMVNFRVSDSGDGIYDTAIVVVPASWFSGEDVSGNDPTLLCGNGELEPGEECDDGDLIADDDCSNLCLGTQAPPTTPPAASTCGNLVYKWPNGNTSPYTCGNDLCAGFRCVIGNTISPACYTAQQCASACGGACVDVQTAALDCSTMCTVQPPATEPPPPTPSCANLSYGWPDGTSMPYSCDDTCAGQRCVSGSVISPECYGAGECDGSTCPDGTCVDTPPGDCSAFCAAAELSLTCTAGEVGQVRVAANQNGPCHGNHEECTGALQWKLVSEAYTPEDEFCNSVDDDCNGIVDDLFETCGDPGLCQNTVNTCDPSNPTVPVACVTLPPPSPVEICNNGLDDDCEGSPDDGCECGDNECMPGEDWSNCPADCPMPANNTGCDDSNPCTEGDAWQSGVCVGSPVNCASDNACVVAGVCDPATGCTATKVTCDDAVDCTVDTCDAATGCANTPDDSACSDADPCTIDTCDAVTGCSHAPDPLCAGQDDDLDGYIAVIDGGDDCDDSDPAVHPGAVDVCNALDDDCDAAVDEDFPTTGTTCFSGANSCGITDAGLFVCTADGSGLECTAVTPPAVDTDGDGTADCVDSCAADAAKTAPGDCGCGAPDLDTNGNGASDCLETASADLGITAELNTRVPTAGKHLRVRWDVTNAGPDLVTPGATITGSITGGAVSELRLPKNCSGTAEAFACDTRELKAGRHKAMKVQVVPAAGSTLTFAFAVSGPLVDPNPANQQATVEVPIP